MTMTHEPGDKIFAKVKGFIYWPARINRLPPDVSIPKGKLPIFFYGTHEVFFITPKSIYPYEPNKEKWGKPKTRAHFNTAIYEIENTPDLYHYGSDPRAESFLAQFYNFHRTNAAEQIDHTEVEYEAGTGDKDRTEVPSSDEDKPLAAVVVKPKPPSSQKKGTKRRSSKLSPRDLHIHLSSVGPVANLEDGAGTAEHASEAEEGKGRKESSVVSDVDENHTPAAVKAGTTPRARQTPRPVTRRPVKRARTSAAASAKLGSGNKSRTAGSQPALRRKTKSTATPSDDEDKASSAPCSSVSSLSDSETDDIIDWKKKDEERKKEMETKLRQLEEKKQREENKGVRRARKKSGGGGHHHGEPLCTEPGDSTSVGRRQHHKTRQQHPAVDISRVSSDSVGDSPDQDGGPNGDVNLQEPAQTQLEKSDEQASAHPEPVADVEGKAASNNKRRPGSKRTRDQRDQSDSVSSGGSDDGEQADRQTPLRKRARLQYLAPPHKQETGVEEVKERSCENEEENGKSAAVVQASIDEVDTKRETKLAPAPSEREMSSKREAGAAVSAGHQGRKKRLLASSSTDESESDKSSAAADTEKKRKKLKVKDRHTSKITKAQVSSGDDVDDKTEKRKTIPRHHDKPKAPGAAAGDTVESRLRQLCREVKASLVLEQEDYPACLAALDALATLPVTLSNLVACWEVVDCVKKCRRYKRSEEVKSRAQKVYARLAEVYTTASKDEVSRAQALLTAAHRQLSASFVSSKSGPPSQHLSVAAVTPRQSTATALPRTIADMFQSQQQQQPPVPPPADVCVQQTSEIVPPAPDIVVPPPSLTADLDAKMDNLLSQIQAVEERAAAGDMKVAVPDSPPLTHAATVTASAIDLTGSAPVADDLSEDDDVEAVVNRIESIAASLLTRVPTKSVPGTPATPSLPPATAVEPVLTADQLDLDSRIMRLIGAGPGQKHQHLPPTPVSTIKTATRPHMPPTPAPADDGEDDEIYSLLGV